MRHGFLALILFVAATTAHAQGELKDVGCADEISLRSTDFSQSTEVTFVNDSRRSIRTYWLNYQGKRVFYAEIGPGGNYVQQTYVTHPWVITNDRSGDCVGLYLPAPLPATVVIR